MGHSGPAPECPICLLGEASPKPLLNSSVPELDGVKLMIGDKCKGMLGAVGEVYPDSKYQCCTVHFYRNILS